MKKICFINFKDLFLEQKSGVGVCEEHVVKAFIKAGYKVTVSLSTEYNDAIANSHKKYNKWIQKFTKTGSFLPESWMQFLPIELFHGYHPIYLMDTAMYRSALPSLKITWIHDMMTYIYPQYYSKENVEFHNNLFKKNIKYADIIIATSRTTQNDIVRYCGVPKEKIKVIYHGIGEEYFAPTEYSKIKEKYLFYIGDMRRNKNLINAIKGFERYYRQTGDDIFFYIAGKKKHEFLLLEKYVKEAGLKDRVKFLGFVTDEEKIMYYRNAFALLFISEYEGFGIPIIEAMASKTPVITSNCSSMKELAEGYGILVEPHNLEEIAEGISKLNDNTRRQQIIKKAYRHACKFTWTRAEKEYVRLLQRKK